MLSAIPTVLRVHQKSLREPHATDGSIASTASNIRPDGLSAAIDRLCCPLTASRHRKLSGVELKDERALPAQPKAIGTA